MAESSEDHISILLIHFVRLTRWFLTAVADAFAHERADKKPCALASTTLGAHATARGASGDEQAVNTPEAQPGGKMRPKERDACRLVSASSPSIGVKLGTNAASVEPAVILARAGTFRPNGPRSDPSGWTS